jgi:Transglycosylase SLT domain
VSVDRAAGLGDVPRAELPLRRIVMAVAVVALAAFAVPVARKVVTDALHSPRPAVAHPDVAAALWDLTPVGITLWTPDLHVPATVTRERLLTDASLWRRMHMVNWNVAPEGVREAGLDAMLAAYADVLSSPSQWDRMTAHDWDRVPQPVRTVAYRRMVQYWSGFYDVGAGHGLPASLVTQTLAAIVMSESWFDHRAVNVGFGGQRDFGLAQASEGARARMRALHDAGLVDVRLEDADYFNPWAATRFVAIWMTLLLDDVDGDLEWAVRAYNRGVSRAFDERGDAYLAAVQRRLHRFIQNRDSSPAWSHVWWRARAIPWHP